MVRSMSAHLVTNGVRLGVLGALAVPQLLIGLWAVVAPHNWFERFPGIDPRLVAAQPPFNEHLATDAGAGFLATGVALAVAALWGHRAALQIALLAYAAFSAPHLLYHAANPAAALSGGEDLLNVGVLASGPALAALFAWRTRSARPATQQREEVSSDDAEVASWDGSARDRARPVGGARRGVA